MAERVGRPSRMAQVDHLATILDMARLKVDLRIRQYETLSNR